MFFVGICAGRSRRDDNGRTHAQPQPASSASRRRYQPGIASCVTWNIKTIHAMLKPDESAVEQAMTKSLGISERNRQKRITFRSGLQFIPE